MRRVPCAACGSNRQETFLVEAEFRVVTCVDCHHLYTSPLFGNEEYVARYRESRDWIKPSGDELPSGADVRLETCAAGLASLIPAGSRVLEVGCSKGRFLKYMQQRGFDCHGVEPSRDAEIAAQLVGPDRIVRAFYDRPLAFVADAVAMFEVLEHVPDPYVTAQIVLEQLRPGGYFMGSIPNASFIRMKVWPRRMFALRTLAVPLTMDPGNHVNYFSATGIQRMLDRVGFQFLWVRNAPVDFNYLASRYSPLLKRRWWLLAEATRKLTGRLIGSNIWFLAQKH